MTIEDRAQTIRFFEGLGKPLSTREIEILVEDEKRTCAECEYFAGGRFSSYCSEFHDPREVAPGDPACQWFGRGG